jgi:pilus assembly protein CpaF
MERVTDILINGPGKVFVDCGNGMQEVNITSHDLSSPQDVRALALKLSQQANARLDDACPIVDAQLRNNVRLHAVLSPICPPECGALISLRVTPTQFYTLDKLSEMGMFDSQVKRRLKKVVAAQKNIIISGSTGSGKTTLMTALLQEVPKSERVIAIEEARELPSGISSGLVLLSAKQANSEGSGEVKLAKLLKATLRMRPDRIVLGECRGDEVREFLLCLGAGYSGSFTTIHASSARAVRDRVHALAFMAGVYSQVVQAQFDNFVDVVIHVKKTPRGRVVEEVLELDKLRPVHSKLEEL